MKNLITYEDISRLARPCSTEREMAEALIAEAQRVDVKPRLGDALYLKVLEEADSFETVELQEGDIIDGGDSSEASELRFGTLLDGGEWEGCNGGMNLLTGLRTALAYYALARIVRDGNIQATTYGAVVKDDQYSADAEKAERQRQYRELFGQADSYMAEVLHYLAQNRQTFPEYKTCAKMRSNRMTIRTIGK